MTENEKQIKADKEKEKGNEAFKAGMKENKSCCIYKVVQYFFLV